VFNPPASRSEAIEQIVKQRCGIEFPGVTWEEMDAAVAASPISEDEFAFECPEGTDKIVSKAVWFRKTHRGKLRARVRTRRVAVPVGL